MLVHPLFSGLMLGCLTSTIQLLERQYSKYFAMDITPELMKATESARPHNLDSEEIVGMFSAAQKTAPGATMLLSVMHASILEQNCGLSCCTSQFSVDESHPVWKVAGR